jgi:nucleoside-diphosphate-sugar epimerase
MVADITDKELKRRYDLTKPQGVRGTNRDNSRLREALAWVLQLSLERGLGQTISWIGPALKKCVH